MNFENSKTHIVDGYKENSKAISEEMQLIHDNIPISEQDIKNTPWPQEIYYPRYILNPQDYRLANYKDRSIFESNVIEYWAPITDYVIPNIIPGRYWLSTWGRSWNTNTQGPIGLSVHSKGYYQMSLGTTIPGKRVTRKYHRAIMLTFAYFDGCDKFEVNHRDSIRQDCRLYNLEWMTPSENTIHGIEHGFKKVFGNDYSVNLTEDQIKQIIELANQGLNAHVILYKLGLEGLVSPTTVRLIITGKIRRNITGL